MAPYQQCIINECSVHLAHVEPPAASCNPSHSSPLCLALRSRSLSWGGRPVVSQKHIEISSSVKACLMPSANFSESNAMRNLRASLLEEGVTDCKVWWEPSMKQGHHFTNAMSYLLIEKLQRFLAASDWYSCAVQLHNYCLVAHDILQHVISTACWVNLFIMHLNHVISCEIPPQLKCNHMLKLQVCVFRCHLSVSSWVIFEAILKE
jgi:hypothetical protein